MDFDAQHHYTRVCVGLIEEYGSRGSRPVTTTLKSVETIARNHGVAASDLSAECREILDLSVAPFGAERLARFTELTEMLRERGVL